VAGLVIAARSSTQRPVLWLVVGLTAQAAVLWTIASASGAATPYMAIKMAYLAIYAAVMGAVIATRFVARVNTKAAWIAAFIAVAVVLSTSDVGDRPAPVVTSDLYDVGVWARTHVPVECVDYLVRNEYTAYWLHVAVLRNARLSERSRDDNLYLTEPSFARWIEDGPPPYAIALRSVLPVEIRERTQVRYQSGDALVLERVNSTRAAAADTCAASPATTTP
jgi:hypothetical protein